MSLETKKIEEIVMKAVNENLEKIVSETIKKLGEKKKPEKKSSVEKEPKKSSLKKSSVEKDSKKDSKVLEKDSEKVSEKVLEKSEKKTVKKVKEVILEHDDSNYTMFPIKYQKIWQLVKNHQKMFWFAEDIDYGADLKDWEKLKPDEVFFIENILAFFAGADGIVLENLMTNFSKEVQIPEARAFYAVQAHIEEVHSEVYSQLIEKFISNENRKKDLFEAIKTIPCVKRKADWAKKWMDPNSATFAERLIAFVIVEGVFFSGAFCSIFWLKNRGLMVKSLGQSNEFIARDEGIHARFGVELYSLLKNKVSQTKVHQMFKEAIEIEKEFIIESLPCRLIGMNSENMIEHIKFIADGWIESLNYKKLFNIPNSPFDFMIMIELDGKTNFFEKRVSEYAKGSTTIGTTKDFKIVEEF